MKWPTKVWIFSFEFEGFVKVGGLGAAVARHAKALASAGVDVTVLTPSHGKKLEKPKFEGEWKGFRTGVDGNNYPYSVRALSIETGNVKLVVFEGVEEATKRFLDDPVVYREAAEKTALYTRAVLHWSGEQKSFPDVLHSNDWPSVLAAFGTRLLLREKGLTVPWVHTVHLVSSPSFPWHYASEKWSGVRSVWHRIIARDGLYSTWVSDAWDSVGGNVDAFAALESDLLTSVSKGYLEELTMRWTFLPKEKTGVVYNSTDWRKEETEQFVLENFGGVERHRLRGKVVQKLIEHAEYVSGSLKNCGLLVVAHGRLVWQKGFDILIRAIDYMDHEIGVLVMGLSSGDTGHEQYLEKLAAERNGRILITKGALPQELLKAVIFSANVAAMPSRYEPFGISSVEAQSLGTPVAATSVAGLSETVKDIYFFDDGGGMLVGYEDVGYLGAALTSLAWLTESKDTGHDFSSRIPIEWIRRRFTVLKDIRDSAVKWVDTRFREKNTGQMLLECYRKAKEVALRRDGV